jgi:hypothetical protein
MVSASSVQHSFPERYVSPEFDCATRNADSPVELIVLLVLIANQRKALRGDRPATRKSMQMRAKSRAHFVIASVFLEMQAYRGPEIR